jgi:hypothetical protein
VSATSFSYPSPSLRQAAISWSAASLARPTLSGSRPEPSATADRLSSSPATRSRGAPEYRIVFSRIFVHKGLKDSAWGFNPRYRQKRHPPRRDGSLDVRLGPPNRASYIAGPLSPLHLAARPESRTACPTKPKLYVANRLGRPRKRGALHKMDVGEVGRTRTKTKRDHYPHVVRP